MGVSLAMEARQVWDYLYITIQKWNYHSLSYSKAIVDEDQIAATEEKTKLEEAQRAGHKERREAGTEWVTKHFELEGITFSIDGTPLDVPKYNYKHADVRPWDGRNDLYQYENDYTVCTKTRHKTPMIRTQSIVSVLDAEKVKLK